MTRREALRRQVSGGVGRVSPIWLMKAKRDPNSAAASKNITKRIQELGDWRGETLDEAAFKRLIRSAVVANSAARARRASPKK